MESGLNGQQDNENKRIVFVISVLVVSVVSFRIVFLLLMFLLLVLVLCHFVPA